MELINFLLFITTLIIGLIVIKYSNNKINQLVKTKWFKELISESKYSEVLLWYSSYFIKLILYITLLLISVSFLGFTSQVLTMIVFLVILSITAILVFSVKDLIPSAIAGAYLIHGKAIKKGDVISVKGFKGKIIEVSLLNIKLRDSDGKIVLIPNKIIATDVIKKL